MSYRQIRLDARSGSERMSPIRVFANTVLPAPMKTMRGPAGRWRRVADAMCNSAPANSRRVWAMAAAAAGGSFGLHASASSTASAAGRGIRGLQCRHLELALRHLAGRRIELERAGIAMPIHHNHAQRAVQQLGAGGDRSAIDGEGRRRRMIARDIRARPAHGGGEQHGLAPAELDAQIGRETAIFPHDRPAIDGSRQMEAVDHAMQLNGRRDLNLRPLGN